MNDLDDNDPPPDEIRDAKTIARRTLALFGTVGVALGAPRDDVLQWLKESNLWDELSPLEGAYLSDINPTRRQNIDATWKSEGLTVLLWALGKISVLPAPNQQCDTSIFQKLLPPYASISAADFISSAERRSDDALLAMADELMDLHWHARDAQINGREMSADLDIEIIQERHLAINWAIGYDGLPWDEVTTDT